MSANFQLSHEYIPTEPTTVMSKISIFMKYNFGTMTIGKLGSLSQLTVQYVNESAEASAKLDATFLTLQKVTTAFTASMVRNHRSNLTNSLVESGKNQMIRYSTLRKLIESLQFSPNAAISRDAALIYDVFKTVIPKMKTSKPASKNGFLQSLVGHLRDDNYTPLIENLGINPWIVELENAVNVFTRILLERELELANINKSTSASKLRAELIVALEDFFAFVKGRANSTSAPVWVEIYAQINKFYLSTGRTRRTMSGDETSSVEKQAV